MCYMKRRLSDLPDILNVSHIREVLDIGERQAYELVNSGQFHVVRINRRIKISKNVFINWLEGGDNHI
ncbi:helix-turn-helix domain-containing protein [Metabacillus sp. YM-086]|uniref:helix-turn-helix domain-containing protein n=1 Tax=Metabacillus sp. YM-086 TaxID=3341729 RepID=UPI003A884278